MQVSPPGTALAHPACGSRMVMRATTSPVPSGTTLSLLLGKDSMRSIPLMAVSTLVLASAWACGGDNGTNVGPNTPPVAAFTAPTCTVNTACQFADASTDADGSIASRSWDFGDPSSGASNAAQDANPSHTFAAAGTYQVKLTVTDNDGASDDQTNAVTVNAGTGGGQAPTSSFDLPATCTAGTPCGFHSTSTDPDGEISAATFAWNFGDNGTGNTPDATHTFAQAGTYTVTLNVTDTQGLSATSSQQLTVAPPASQDCTTSTLSSGTRVVSCVLTMTQRSTLKFSVTSHACQLAANQLRVTAPRDQYIFFNLCTKAVGSETTLNDANGNPLVLEQGTPVAVRFEQGKGGPSDPATGDPGIHIDNPSPNNWTLNIDDGGAPGTPGEPDFNDAVISVTATAAP
jgi:PKD repeat protein